MSPGNDQTEVELSQKQKKSISALMTKQIKDNYAFPEEFENIKAMIADLEKSEEFKETKKASEFGSLMTSALRDFTNDPHFNVIYSPPMFENINQMLSAGSGNGNRRGPQVSSSMGRGLPDEKRNFNLSKLEVLPGNIGYLKLDRMPNIRLASSTVDAAMSFLKHTDAFILDLRGNPGGIGGFTPYLASYFFSDERKLLFTREFPAYDSTSYFYTEEKLPSERFIDQPLYILIDRFTGSAASNLSYTLQNHGRAKVIGEVTGEGVAGGHSAGMFPLQSGFVATVPIANVVHPETGTNWSMTGVVPNTKIASSLALDEAHKLALTELMESSKDREIKTILMSELEKLKEAKDQVVSTKSLDTSALQEYIGTYGERKILVENGELLYSRSGQPKLLLEAKEKDLYKIVMPPNARLRGAMPLIRFDRNEKGAVHQISFIGENGEVINTSKKS